MSKQALYRTWRPRRFSDVVAQESIVQTLQNQVQSGRPAHAYLFSGSRGTGKTTCAKILAQAVNCLATVDGDPCGACENCLAYEKGALTDVVEIDAASNNSVEDVRELREEAIFAPATGKYRVYIIDEAHMLSKNAFNALLKIMEEPPAHVIFILATTETHKIPETIISRCQRFDFRRYHLEDIMHLLQRIAENEGMTLTDEAAELIAAISDGGMRDAVSALDQCYALSKEITADLVRTVHGLSDSEEIFRMIEAILSQNTGEALEILAGFYYNGADFRFLTEQLLSYFRDLMVLRSANGKDGLLFGSKQEIAAKKSLAETVPLSFLLRSIDSLVPLYGALSTDKSARALFEMTLIQMTSPLMNQDVSALMERIERLEMTERRVPNPVPPIHLDVKVVEKPAKEEEVHEQSSPTNGKIPPWEEAPAQTPEATIELEAALNAEENEPPEKPPWEEQPAESVPEEMFSEAKVEDTLEIADGVVENEVTIPEEAPPAMQDASLSLLRGEPSTEEVIAVEKILEEWSEIVILLQKKNPPLAATLEGSKAYVQGDLLLIDAPNTVFLNLMRASDATKESLRNATKELTGKNYRLGPVKKGTTVQVKETVSALPDILKTASENGIPIQTI